jgi:hypothetical protein
MAARAESIGEVRLARSLARVLALPILVIAAGVGLAVSGVVLVGGTAGLAMAGAGGVLVVVGVVLAAMPLSVRVHVEESVVRVRWLFGRQVHLLTAGSLTRIHLRGEGASRLTGGFGFGWSLGRALLRDQEHVHVVRLAPTESVILIPTARGRLAIASSDEQHLIETLTHAAQARARAEELLEVAPTALPTAAAAERVPQPGDPDFDPRLLSGIERALYEEWLVREQADALAALRREEPEPATEPLAEPSPEPVRAAVPPSAESGPVIRRPSWARRREGAPAMIPMPTVPSRVRALPRRPRRSWFLPVLPLAAAGAAWAIGVFAGEMPSTGSDSARLTALALVLAGPGTAIGAIMARTWWPRIAGVVVAGGLASSIFIGRSLINF